MHGVVIPCLQLFKQRQPSPPALSRIQDAPAEHSDFIIEVAAAAGNSPEIDIEALGIHVPQERHSPNFRPASVHCAEHV
jgi:hypothetical protein